MKNIKQIHPKDVLLLNLGKFYYVYGKDSYILSYVFKYKLTYIERAKVYSCAFPKQSLPKVQATLDNNKINYLIVDKRNNYEVDDKSNNGNLNTYDKWFKYIIYVKEIGITFENKFSKVIET